MRRLSLTKKIIFILAIITLVALLPLLFKKAPHESLPYNKVEAVLYWLDDNRLLLSSNRRLVVYDVKRKTEIIDITAHYGATNLQAIKCISGEGAIFAFQLPTQDNARSNVSLAPTLRWLRNWHDLDTYTDLDYAEWWNVNPLDCHPFNYQREKSKSRATQGTQVEQSMNFPKLLKTNDGLTEVYQTSKNRNVTIVVRDEVHQNASTAEQDTTGAIIHISKQLQIEVPPYVRINSPLPIYPTYDVSRNLYLWYTSEHSFSADPNEWSLMAWTVTPALTVQKVFALPAGPWVYPHSFLKQLSCFACGCGCYEHLSIQMANGKIFLMVWGKAVDDSDMGLYQLEMKGTDEKLSWQPIVTGSVGKDFAVAPNGCSIAYTRDTKAFIANTCTPNKSRTADAALR